jgi:hypothetical protein
MIIRYPDMIDELPLPATREERNKLVEEVGDLPGTAFPVPPLALSDLAYIVQELVRLVGATSDTTLSSHHGRIGSLETNLASVLGRLQSLEQDVKQLYALLASGQSEPET